MKKIDRVNSSWKHSKLNSKEAKLVQETAPELLSKIVKSSERKKIQNAINRDRFARRQENGS